MALRRKPNFEELVQENRNQILSNEFLLDEIDKKIENRWQESIPVKNTN